MSHKPVVAHTDIRADSWIARICPKKLLPYIRLARIDRPIGSWLLLFPAWWSITLAAGGFRNIGIFEWKLMALFAAGAIIMRGAGCTINDIWDRNLDSKVERTSVRPLPAGDITLSAAITFLIILLLAGLIVLLQMNRLTIILGVISLIPVLIYPLMKRVTFWPQLFLGFTINWGALMGWTAVTGDINNLAPFLLYSAGIFWTLGYDTIYAHQDTEDDALIGIKSTALRFGDHSPKWISGFYMVAIALIIAAAFTAKTASILLILPAFHLYLQQRNWDIKSPISCLETFKSNKWFGWLVLLAFAL